ncbi:MAG: YncE family protein [Nitrososphaerota archaeon]|nr:YncE family protein [Nitrososphaerota archaeon]
MMMSGGSHPAIGAGAASMIIVIVVTMVTVTTTASYYAAKQSAGAGTTTGATSASTSLVTTSSAAGPAGQVVLGNGSSWVAYDSVNNDVYVVNTNIYGEASVSVLSGGRAVSTIPVGAGDYESPSSIAVDTSNGYAYVASAYTDSVAVISGTSLVANISLRPQMPETLLFDPENGYIYVADTNVHALPSVYTTVDGNGNTVSVISGTAVIANITVGSAPFALVYNPSNGRVYVGDAGSANFSVISGTIVVGQFGGSYGTLFGAYDPANRFVYFLSSEVTVVSNETVVATIPVGYNPWRLAYDPANQFMYVVALGEAGISNSSVVAISGTRVAGNLTVGDYAEGILYDPQNQGVYVALSDADQVAVMSGTSVVDRLAAPSPTGLAYDAADGSVYVTDYYVVFPGAGGVTIFPAG